MKKLSTFFKRTTLFGFMGLISIGLNAQEPIWSIEAEDFVETTTGTKVTVQLEGACYMSGCSFIENISPNAYFQYSPVTVEEEGTYELRMFYTMADEAGRGVGITVNNQYRDTVWIMERTPHWSGAPAVDPITELPVEGTEGPKMKSALVYLEAGGNILKIGGSGEGYGPNFDRFELHATDEVIAKPEDQLCSWHWDYTDEAEVTSNSTGNLVALYDNNDKTIFAANDVEQLIVDFEFEAPLVVVGYLFYSGDFLKPVELDDFEVQASLDKEIWINATKEVTKKKVSGQVFRTNPLEGFKYFRLVYDKPEGDSNIELAEFQLFGYPQTYPEDLIDVVVDGETVTGNNGEFTYSDIGLTNFKEIAPKTLDGLKNKYTVNGKTFWLQYDFFEDTEVLSYSLAKCHFSDEGRNPKSWKLKASADYGLTWETVDEVTDFEWPSVTYGNMKFNVSNPGAYVYYRLEMEDNWGASMSHLSEYQLFGVSLPIIVGMEELPVKTSLDLKVISEKGKLVIYKGDHAEAQFKIYNITGTLIELGAFRSTAIDIALPHGIYIVEVRSESGVVRKKAIVR